MEVSLTSLVPMFQKSNTWQRLIDKTKGKDDYLKKGKFKRSIDRNKEESQTRRTIEPSYKPPKMASSYDIYYHQPPQTTKHKTTTMLKFKPPLPPKEIQTGGERYSKLIITSRRHNNLNNRSSFKLNYTDQDIKAHKPKSLSKKVHNSV